MPHGFQLVLKFAACSCFLVPWFMGCAAFHPMDGVPVRYLPEEMKVGDRSGKRTIKLSLLGQPWDGIHRVDSGDVLGIYIGGILGKKDENPQVFFPQNSESTPSAGTPVTVREDGTISLPMIKPLYVRGKTTGETEETIRKAYTSRETGRELLKVDEERILVSLQKARQTRVMVVRQDSRSEPLSNQSLGMVNLGTTKRGTGKLVSLPAYHNDVLNALVATDGLPGLDAENAVYIIRRQLGADGKPTPASSAIDPEELIRRSKSAAEKQVVRGQNSDSGNAYQNTTSWGRPDFDSNSAIPAYSDNTNTQAPGDQRSPRWDTPPVLGVNGGYAPISPLSSTQNFVRPSQADLTMDPALSENDRGERSAVYATMPPVRTAERQVSYQGIAVPTNPFEGSVPAAPGYSSPVPIESNFAAPQFEGNEELVDGGYDAYGDGGMDDGHKIIRIPIRLGPGEHVDINPEDVILYEGDIVFIESRDSEVFFTGGLLGGGQYTIPRDFDLDILRALSIATSRTGGAGAARQVGGVSALNSDVTISPSNVVVIRQLPEGGEVPIKIDIYRARNDLSERLVIQPGDYIYLQYTPAEAVAAFVERHLLEGALFGLFTQQMGNRN